jgi:hypothetical protein
LFVGKVQQGYRPNSFHNFDHAFSVAHVAFMMFETVADIKRHLTRADILRCVDYIMLAQSAERSSHLYLILQQLTALPIECVRV